jgi:hypothetical protein
MPAKMARSAPRPSSGLPEMTIAVRTSRLPCKRPRKSRISKTVRESSGESRLMCSFTRYFSDLKRRTPGKNKMK